MVSVVARGARRTVALTQSKVLSPESQAIRAFVAIDVPPNVLARLMEVQHELRALLPPRSTSWTKPDRMHLTLRFLGNIDPACVPELESELQAALTGFDELELVCERLGCFPDLRFPRVVWAWVHDTTERLQALHHRIDEATRSFAEKPAETRFVGHITLARPKQIKRSDAGRLARLIEGAANRSFGSWRAREIRLLRSELSQEGAKHHELARVLLD